MINRQGMGAGLAVVLAVVGVSAMAEPPPPPGGHIPITFGGANQGGYPAPPSAVDGSAISAPSLAEVVSAPNPFSGVTVIRFELRQGEEARLRIFDLAGRQVKELVHRADAAGSQAVQWDGRDQNGSPLASGIYFYVVKAGARSVTKRLVLLR